MAKLFVQSIYGICKRHAYLLRGRNLAEGHAEGACLHDLPPRNKHYRQSWRRSPGRQHFLHCHSSLLGVRVSWEIPPGEPGKLELRCPPSSPYAPSPFDVLYLFAVTDLSCECDSRLSSVSPPRDAPREWSWALPKDSPTVLFHLMILWKVMFTNLKYHASYISYTLCIGR